MVRERILGALSDAAGAAVAPLSPFQQNNAAAARALLLALLSFPCPSVGVNG